MIPKQPIQARTYRHRNFMLVSLSLSQNDCHTTNVSCFLSAFSVTWHRHQELHPAGSWGFHSLRGRQVYFHTTAAAAAENYLKRVGNLKEKNFALWEWDRCSCILTYGRVYVHTYIHSCICTYLHMNVYTYILTHGSSTNYLKKIRNSAYSDWGSAKDFSGNLILC